MIWRKTYKEEIIPQAKANPLQRYHEIQVVINCEHKTNTEIKLSFCVVQPSMDAELRSYPHKNNLSHKAENTNILDQHLKLQIVTFNNIFVCDIALFVKDKHQKVAVEHDCVVGTNGCASDDLCLASWFSHATKGCPRLHPPDPSTEVNRDFRLPPTHLPSASSRSLKFWHYRCKLNVPKPLPWS